jgi:tRNA A37 methylthiotransferase MiaB
MSNIIVIYPQPDEHKEPRFGFSYDWALLGTVLHNNGHNVIMRDYSVMPFDKDSIITDLSENNIDIVVIEFDSFSLKRCENTIHGNKLIKYLKHFYPNIPIIIYGHYPCITKRNIDCADFTIMENNLNDIFSAIHSVLPSFQRIAIKTFDDLPFIDRQLINRNVPYFNQHYRSTLIQTAVGCDNTCIFCQRKGWQRNYTAHSDDYVFREFDLLHQQEIVNLWITDENFTFNLPRAKRLLSGLIENKLTLDMNISISSWANIDEEFLNLAKTANIKTISFGIETGNTDILRFYRKNIDLQKAKYIIRYADSIGIYTAGNFILGAPMETFDTINQTFVFIRECNFDSINFKILVYMQGAELFSTLPISLQSETSIFSCSENDLCNFSLQELQSMKREFLDKYYKDRKEYLQNKIERYGMPYHQ